MDFGLATSFLIAMLAIVNPIGKIPVWVRCSDGEDESARRWLAFLVTATSGGVLVGSLWGGSLVLRLFSVDLASLRVGGGIVILITGLAMLQGRATDVDPDTDDGDGNALQRAQTRFRSIVVPMAVPIIAGPGSITTAIVYSSRATTAADVAALTGILLGITGVIYVALMSAPYVRRVVGDTGLTIVTRLFGLLLVVIAVQLMATGLGELFPQWLEDTSPISDDVRNSGG